MIKYTISIMIIALFLLSFMSLINYKMKFIKKIAIKITNKNKKYKRYIFIKELMYIYIYIWFIRKRTIRLIRMLFKGILRSIKVFFRIGFIFIRVKSFKKFIYVACTMIMLLTLGCVLIIKIEPFCITNVWDKVLMYVAFLGSILGLYIIIEAINKFKQLKTLLTTYSIFVIFCLVLTALVICENLKNNGIRNTEQSIAVITLIIITNISLLLILKQVLDRASMFISATYGLVLYMCSLFFITIAIGMYITASYPLNFIKDEIIVTNGNNGIITYILSYSYRGARYLWNFPNKNDFLALKLDSVPYKIYLLYFIGNFINIIIFGFYVSYSVSMYLLRVSQYESYKEYINRKTFTSEYIKFLKIKFYIIKNIIKYNNVYRHKKFD